MGEYFLYANLDRREFFRIDALGGATKATGIGRNCGARALGLLLTARGRDVRPRTMEGAWAGQRTVALGDQLADGGGLDPEWAGESPYATVERDFRDISSAIAVMLVEHDGPDELLEVSAQDPRVLVVLGEIAMVHGVESVARALTSKLGDRWPRLYAAARAKSNVAVPPP